MRVITFFLFIVILSTSCKSIESDITRKVYKNEYILVSYIRFDSDSIYHYNADLEFQGAMPYIISGNEIWENGYNIQFRDTWVMEKDKIVSKPPYKFEFKPLSTKETKEYYKKVQVNN